MSGGEVGSPIWARIWVGEERDKREGRLAGGADEGEDFIDPSQEDGPSGRPGRGGIRWQPFCPLWLERRGRWSVWKTGTGYLIGQCVILLGPGRDQRSQVSVGSEDAVVAVAVDSGWWEDFGQPIQELEGGEAKRGTAGQVGPRQEVEDLVGAVVDEMKAVEGKGGPGAVADQSFEAGAVGGLDTDAGIETEPTPVIPGEHIFGLVGLQEAVAPKMSQDPGTDRVLEALQEFAGKVGGFVEAEAGLWILALITRDLLEEAIDHTQMVVKVGVQGRTEAVQETDGA